MVTVPAGSPVDYVSSNTSDTVSISAGNLIDYKLANNATCGNEGAYPCESAFFEASMVFVAN
jgi:hypothetical protein